MDEKIAEFFTHLESKDPELAEEFNLLISDYLELIEKETLLKYKHSQSVAKYFKSEKGKLKNREANQRYYNKKKELKQKNNISHNNIKDNEDCKIDD